jgi:hypothetical protein
MEDLCPKCGAPKGGESCARCGVVFAKFDPDALALDVSPDIAALFAHAEADWSDRARHALFTERALAAGAAGYAAARYRRRGPDDPVAAEQLARIASRLEQALAMSSATDARSGTSPRSRGTDVRRPIALYLLLIILFLGAGALGLALMWR